MKAMGLRKPMYEDSFTGNEFFNLGQLLQYIFYKHFYLLAVHARQAFTVLYANNQTERVPFKKEVPWVDSCINYLENSLELIDNVPLLSYKTEYIDVVELIETLVDNRRPFATIVGVEFRVNVQKGTAISSNRVLLEIVIGNLLDNAIQFSQDSKHERYTYIEVRDILNETHIKIEDNGVGMSHKHLHNIFKMFYQEANTLHGLGVGLFLVKKALKKLGGHIDVVSSKGFGTEFHIQLPHSNTIPNLNINRIPKA